MKKYILLSAILAGSLLGRSQVNVQFKNTSDTSIIVQLVKLDVFDTIPAKSSGKPHRLPGIATNDMIFIKTVPGNFFYQVNMNRSQKDTVYTKGAFMFSIFYHPSKKIFYSRLNPLK